jgi:hypothetical protein
MRFRFVLLALCVPSGFSGCAKIAELTGTPTTSDCPGPRTYAAGSTLSGATDSKSCKGPDGSAGQLYSMTLSQQTNLDVSVAASGFSPFLGAYSAAGETIGENNTDAKLKLFLPAGSYQVFVSSINGKDGSFTLASAPTELTGGTVCAGLTTRGASISGALTSADCGGTLSKFDAYDIRLGAGASLTVSFAVDRPAGLFVTNATGGTMASREMTTGGTWNTTITAATAGWYGVRLESRTINGASSLPVSYSVSLH